MRALLVVSVLCGCTSSGMTSGHPACAGDPLVATWAKPGQGQTWAIHDDCTWSMIDYFVRVP